LPKKNILMVAAFVVPVLCCLIGVGAFVLLTSPPPTDHNGPKPPDDLKAKIIELKDKLAELNRMIETLQEKLQKEQLRVELAQRIDQLINHLEATTYDLLGQIPDVAEQLAMIQAGIRDMDTSDLKEQQNRSDEHDLEGLQHHSTSEMLKRASRRI